MGASSVANLLQGRKVCMHIRFSGCGDNFVEIRYRVLKSELRTKTVGKDKDALRVQK